jgi:hypothetical protein
MQHDPLHRTCGLIPAEVTKRVREGRATHHGDGRAILPSATTYALWTSGPDRFRLRELPDRQRDVTTARETDIFLE